MLFGSTVLNTSIGTRAYVLTINQSVSQSISFLAWPKQRTATSRTTETVQHYI